uniref:BSD domain-containing protein n=1 Tax=Parascaris univalens TaxID=6257 RepID=A0A915A8K2_PARUN
MSSKENSDNETKADDVNEEGAVNALREQQRDWLSASASWGTSWLKSAKEKTFTTLELVKKDLSEFSDAVASEANAIANTTLESVKHQAHTFQQLVSVDEEDSTLIARDKPLNETNKTPPAEAVDESGDGLAFAFGWTPKLPQVSALANNAWVKSLVETVKSIAQEDTTSNEDQYTEVIVPRSLSDQQMLTRKSDIPHCILYAIQTDRQTYLAEPEGDEHLFTLWEDEFKLSEHHEEINSLLKNCPPMRGLYQELVPSMVDNLTFWRRYFYKVYQAEMIDRCKKETLTDDALHVATESARSNQSLHSDKLKAMNSKSGLETAGEVSQDGHSNNDETWSVCSSTMIDVQEIHDDSDEGPQTPRLTDSPSASLEKSEKSPDEWVDWEE